jgi:hypothetical protein
LTLKSGDWIILLLFGCLVFFYFRGIDTAAGKDSLAEDVFDKKWMLFILDFHDFSCMTCLDSFLGLTKQLPSRFKTSGAWGILVVKRSEKEDNTRFWIAEKKLRGFVQANDIAFPIIVDRSRVFERMAEMGSCVLVFDGTASQFHKYDFPLTGYQFSEIFRILNN